MTRFNIATAVTAAGLTLLFYTQSGAQNQATQPEIQRQASYNAPDSRYVKATVSDHFSQNKKREMVCDCKTLIPVKLATGQIKLSPLVSFAAQFDLVPPRDLLNQFNKMSQQEKKAQLASMSDYEASILTSVANLPPNIQERFYIARDDHRMLDTNETQALYEYLVRHAIGSHGVDKTDFARVANLCKPYHGIE